MKHIPYMQLESKQQSKKSTEFLFVNFGVLIDLKKYIYKYKNNTLIIRVHTTIRYIHTHMHNTHLRYKEFASTELIGKKKKLKDPSTITMTICCRHFRRYLDATIR